MRLLAGTALGRRRRTSNARVVMSVSPTLAQRVKGRIPTRSPPLRTPLGMCGRTWASPSCKSVLRCKLMALQSTPYLRMLRTEPSRCFDGVVRAAYCWASWNLKSARMPLLKCFGENMSFREPVDLANRVGRSKRTCGLGVRGPCCLCKGCETWARWQTRSVDECVWHVSDSGIQCNTSWAASLVVWYISVS